MIDLGRLGRRVVRQCPEEPGHWLWLDGFGWHDCAPAEDARIEAARAKKD